MSCFIDSSYEKDEFRALVLELQEEGFFRRSASGGGSSATPQPSAVSPAPPAVGPVVGEQP